MFSLNTAILPQLRDASANKKHTNSDMPPACLCATCSHRRLLHATHEQNLAAFHVADQVQERMVCMEDDRWRRRWLNDARDDIVIHLDHSHRRSLRSFLVGFDPCLLDRLSNVKTSSLGHARKVSQIGVESSVDPHRFQQTYQWQLCCRAKP